ARRRWRGGGCPGPGTPAARARGCRGRAGAWAGRAGGQTHCISTGRPMSGRPTEQPGPLPRRVVRLALGVEDLDDLAAVAGGQVDLVAGDAVVVDALVDGLDGGA